MTSGKIAVQSLEKARAEGVTVLQGQTQAIPREGGFAVARARCGRWKP